MNVLGIIPARYASSRFPGKPLIDIEAKSMIRRVYEGAAQSKMISELVVATDDQRIFDHVQSFGGNVMMTAEEHSNGTERCGEVVSAYPDAEVIINIQGDEPLIQSKQLEKVIALFQDAQAQIGTLVKKMNDSQEIQNPNRVKVVLSQQNEALYFSRNPIPHATDFKSVTYYKHIGIYAWRRDVLTEIVKLQPVEIESAERLEQLRWLANGYKIKVAETSIETPNIDTPEDVDQVLKQLQNQA